jgi:hypothetical protein
MTNSPVTLIPDPNIGILDMRRDKDDEFVRSDVVFLQSMFTNVRTVNLVKPKCDVLFFYATLTVDGGIIGTSRGLRDIIRDSGAKVVVVASPNPVGHYIKAGRLQPYGRANLVMTLDRKGDAFVHFFTALFLRMKRGVSMPVAWVELNPQVPAPKESDRPETIFACEIGPVTFSTHSPDIPSS